MSIDTLTSQQTALPPEVAKPYEAALGLIEQPEFAEGFIEQQTINEQEALDSLIADPRREASAYAKSQIEEFAAHKLGITVEEGRERGKEWGKALKDAGSGTSEQTEGKTLQEYLFDSKLSELETDPQYQEQKTEAEEQLALSRERASQIIFTLLQEFQE